MEDIIRLFEANETTFDHYENVLTDVLSFASSEEENGIFSFEATSPLDDRIVEGKIIKAPTARGEQLFRIIRVKKVIPGNYLYIYGRHITYDLLNNFILNIRPTNTTQTNALSAILGGTETTHTFTSTSDVPGINTSNYVRMNPIQAIMGSQSNSALNRWGGYLRRDNFEFKVLATSPDKGYEIRFGKNLIGIEEELDMTEVVTRFYPTAVIEEPTVTALPEKYVDSPLINNYPTPIIKEYRIDLTDDEKLLPIEDIYQLMRDRCNEQFTLKADLPKMNYKIDFVQLRKTEQYKHLAILEELDISDTVWVYVDPLNLSMSARMIKYTHDGLNDRFMSMELGNFKAKLTNQKAEFTKLVETATKELTDGTITTMLKNAVDTIQGNLGGNVVTITVDGKPVAMAFMDTDDVNTANEYVIINDQGIAFGKNGLSNPPEVAIDIDGNVVAESGFFRSITTNLIQSEIGSDLVLSSNTSIKLLANSLVTIDENGITVGREGETIEANLGFDGVRIKDGATEIASFTGSGAVINNLEAESINGDVINIMSSSMTFDIGSETGYFADFSEVLRAIGNRKHLANGVKLTINIRSVLNETISIEGFSGSGSIDVNIYSRVNGYIRTNSNSCIVRVYGKNTTHVVSASGNAITSWADAYTLFNGLNIDSKDGTNGIGIMSQNGSNVYVESCDFVNTNDALYAMSGGKLQALNNKGNATRFAAMASSGRIWLKGTIPDGDSYGFTYNFEDLTRTPSAFSPPATTTGTETRTFNQTDIYTYSVKYGARSTHYGKAAAQNRWDTSMTQMKGRISFGSSVYSFISGRDSGTTSTVKIRLRRQNSTHGTSASVKPTPEWSGAPSFGGATRGNWTPWVTIPYTIFTSSGYTFSFYNGTTGSSYAIWDRAEVQITRTVTQ